MMKKNCQPRNLRVFCTRIFCSSNEVMRKEFDKDIIIHFENCIHNLAYFTFYSTVVSVTFRYIFMVIVLPLESLYSFNAGYGHKPEKLHLAAVNDEIPLEECNPSLYAHCFLEPLESSSKLFLSCLYIDLIRNKTYEIVSRPILVYCK